MPKTGKDLERMLMQNGWFQVKAKGGHRQYKHQTKPGRVTIPWHKNGKGEIAIGTEKKIMEQAGF